MDKNGWKWLYMALHGWNNLEWLGIAGISWNCLEGLDMTVIFFGKFVCFFLEMTGMAVHGLTWLEISRNG